MTSSGEPLIELSEAETPGQAAVAFLECLKADCSVAQSLVYVLDRETGELQLYASSKDASISPRDSAQQLDSTALESVETGEDRHVYVEEIAAESPFRQLLDLDNAEPLSVLKCCPVRGRKQKGRVVALFVMLCHHPPEGSGGPETALAPLSTLKGLLAVAVERTEALSRHRKDLAVVRENSETEVALWNDFYHLFSYRHDSMVLTQELCRMAENLTRGASSIFLVNENGGTLFCQLRNLKVPREDIILPIESSPYGDVVEADSTCIVENLDRYPQEVLLLSEDGKRPTSMMCAAISAKYEDGHGEKVAVMAIASYDTHCFSEKDLKIFMWLVNHATPLYLGVLLNDSVTLTKLQNDSLLQVAGHLFAHLDDMSRLLKEILSHARHLINAERCSLFLLEKNEKNVEELVAVIFDNEIVGEGPRRISLSHSIAGQVASAGELKNVSDVHDESDFCKDVDAATGFKTRNLLCFPIKGKNGSVLGVAQLVNKIGGGNFSYIDEELAKSFAVYCGISICHSLLYTRAKEAQNRSRLATELMIYHMQTNEDDVAALARMPSQIPETARRAIGSFEFSHKGYPDLENMQLLVGMFDEMGLINRWRIPKVILCRFLLTVKRGYRHPPYHNWDHAFAVAHFCYCLWRRCGHLQPLSDMEVLGLFVASLCHDIDHRGTNNAFQVNAHSVLAALYSSEGSVMEHHHFAQTMCILNTENCNIFVNLDRKDYQEVLDIMYEVILDTDIAIHLKKVKDLEKMAEDGVDKNNTKHRHLLLSLLMTSCDLNSSTKPWQDAQEAARKIYMEFFTQGDLEKVLDLQSQEMMDRNSACIPEQQISFTDFIAMPVFKILNKVFPETRNVLARLKANYDTWTKVKQMYWDQASVGSVSSRSSSASAKGSGSGLVSPRGMLGNSSEGEQSRSLRQQMGRFDSTTSISSASSSASCDSSVSACHRSASVGSMGRVSTGKKDPMSVSSSDSVPEEPTSPKKRASTGQLAVKKHPRLRVYETYLSRRASHLIGADYTLQAASLQAGAEAAPDVRPQPHHRRMGQFEAPLVLDRVTDPVRDKLEEEANRLQKADERTTDRDKINTVAVGSLLQPTIVLDSAGSDGLLSELDSIPTSVMTDFGSEMSPYPVSPDCRSATPIVSMPRFERESIDSPGPIRPLRHSADDALRASSELVSSIKEKVHRSSDGDRYRYLSRHDEQVRHSASDVFVGTGVASRRRFSVGRPTPTPGDTLVAKRRRSQGMLTLMR